jgi:hypothetical protein
MASEKGRFEVEFVRLTDPKSGRPMGVVGIDRGDHVYLTATLHPSVLDAADAGRGAFIRCHKAGVPVAAFDNGFYVESQWLREELKAPFAKVGPNGRTLTHTMLDAVAKAMVEAAQTYCATRRNGTVAGSAEASAEAVLLEVATPEAPHG